ncbi:ATP-binding protein [Thiomicrorhabdus arctica]|uniref:ATP-binding protein n=1 Tax=Thiomicrorhabdus arctica TaxID=131540 RepID=UPI000366F144|nr:ATP-binding protein [Thiomicrorhabdus arctica]
MNGFVAEWAGLIFVVIGLSLFFTAFYFRHQSKKLSHALSTLYHLNQSVNLDALDFFDQAWPILKNVGCLQMNANIEWFGEHKSIQFGLDQPSKTHKQTFKVVREDMRFEFVIYLERQANASESLAGLVIKTFINVLEQDLVLKQAEILTSQKRLERYQLFVQHEIKNIAQFIQLLSEQVQTVSEPLAQQRLFERLKQTLPIMAQRAQKTVQQMQQPLAESFQNRSYELKALIEETLRMYDLQASVIGDAITQLPRPLVLEVFKNVLGNFRDHQICEAPLAIEVLTDDINKWVVVQISSACLEDQSKIRSERLFEPFWTTSESGMGLGLFLARELLKQHSGQIEFTKTNNAFGFAITLPGLLE